MSLDDELTTAAETRKEQAAAEAADRIKSGQHWRDWMYIAEGLEIGRSKALRLAGTNNIQHPAYRRAFREWMKPRTWASELDGPTRNHLFWCLDHRNDIEAWRETLAQNERARLNHPTAMKRKYEAAHAERSSPQQAEKPLSPSAKKDIEITRLQAENDQLKLRAARQGEDRDLYDWNKDAPDDIARVLVQRYPSKSKSVASAILKLVKSATPQMAKKATVRRGERP